MGESSNTSNANYVVGNYILDKISIGEGGFGKVYKAQHMHLDKQVCIKVVQLDRLGEDLENILLREAQVLNDLEHENVVRLHDLTFKDNKIHMIMDYVDGGDLATTLKKSSEPLPLGDVDAIIKQVADGLHYAHQKHVIHRDLKPHNLLRYKNGRVVIADFGLAKVIDDAKSQAFHSRLSGAGTPAYMAPEHFEGLANYTSDLYSLGVITYQLLTRQLPFGNGPQAEEGHRYKTPPPLRDFNAKLSPEIEQVVLKMLEKQPQDRYQSSIEFARALHSAILKETLEVPNVAPDNIRKFLPRFADGEVVSLEPGDYQGPFIINKRFHLIGAGPLTKIFAVDEPAFHIQTSGVCLENMVIQRTPENTGEPAIQVDNDISYELRHVTILGELARGAKWEDAVWQLPVDGIDLGRIPVESKQERKIPIEVKDTCTLETDMPGLAVFPTRLSPGPHTLSLEYNASGQLPGRLPDGKITLRSGTEVKTIVVTGQIEQVAVVALPQEEFSLTPMELSYLLQDKAAQTLLRELGNDEDKELLQQWQEERGWRLGKEITNRACELLFELVGRRALIWYVKRFSLNKDDAEEETWEFTAATDSSNNLEIFTTRKRTIRLFCTVHREGRGKPKITDIHFLKTQMGVRNLESLSVLLRLDSSVRSGIPQQLLEQMQDVLIESPRTLDGDQLQGWEALLRFQSDQFKKQRYWVRYSRHNYRDGSSKVTFSLDKDDIKDGLGDPLPYQDLQERTRKTKREMHQIFEKMPDVTPTKKRERNTKGLKIGTLEQFHVENATMTIQLDQPVINKIKHDGYHLPPSGYLHFDAFGDMQQIDRQQSALAHLQQGKSLNSLLPDFFFDAAKARCVPITKHLQAADLLSGTCNNGQIAAIEAALAAPDLLLIQGPPGTGKTTVIAEICYQVAQSGGRTLIASQSNLAVDNALGRIIHRPSIRALRKGNTDSVEDEGRDFTEERVIEKWLTNTANDCQLKLENRKRNIDLFKTLLQDSQQFNRYYTLETQREKDHSSLQRKLDTTKAEVAKLEVSRKKGTAEEEKDAPIQHALATIVAGTVNWSAPGFDSVLKDAYQYIIETSPKQQFKKNLAECLRLAGSLGLMPPADGHLLRGLAWLKRMVDSSTEVWSKSQQCINQVETAIANLAIAEAQKKHLGTAIYDSTTRLSDLSTRLKRSQDSLNNLMADTDRLERARIVYQNAQGRIPSIFQEFISTQIQEAGIRRISNRLSPGQFLPEEIIASMQQNSTSPFPQEWLLVEKDIYTHIQQAIADKSASQRASLRRANCYHRFTQMLASYPDLNQGLNYRDPHNFPTTIPQFDQFLTLIEDDLNTIQTLLTKPPSFFDRFSKERNRQQLLNLVIKVHEALIAAAKSEQYLSTQWQSNNTEYANGKAARLSRAFQQWITEQKQQVEVDYRSHLQEKTRLQAERSHAHQALLNQEHQLDLALQNNKEHTKKIAMLFRDLSQRADLPENLRQIAQKHVISQDLISTFMQDSSQLYQTWIRDTSSLSTYVIELWNDITAAAKIIETRLSQTRAELKQHEQALEKARARQKSVVLTLEQDSQDLVALRSWWKSFWGKIPKQLRPQVAEEDIHACSFLETMQQQFQSWQEEMAKEEIFAQRYDRLITNWVTRLRNLSENDKQELKTAYLKSANVIGITCGQVHKLTDRENQDLSQFNVVIIDEVSKATPPEILLAALKGKKLILIGDQRQLPPMIEDNTLTQLAEESGQDPLAFRYLNVPYFERRYTEAPDEIKRMLYIQYRMHPDIMAAINQFYDRPLECGLNQPDVQRDHLLDSALIRKNKHLIWVSTPLASGQSQQNRSKMIGGRNRMSGQSVFMYQSEWNSFGEEASGTSQINRREVEIIKKMCEELQQLWAPKVAAGAKPKEIGVITFYGAQTVLLQKNLGVVRDGRSMFDALNIRVGTVDRFQGIERAIVIVSMVRNNRRGDIGFAKKDERINVAFSRAQELLVIVGCHDLFCSTAYHEGAVARYSNVAKIVRNRGDFIDISNI